MFTNILIANRGEIACRVIRTAQRTGIATVALLLSTASCASAPAEPAPAGRTVIVAPAEPTRIVPMPLGEALGLFRTVCMETFPVGAEFDQAVMALGMGFTRIDDSTAERRQWRDGERYLTLDTAAGEQDCSFRVAIREQLSRTELVDRIGAALAPGIDVTDQGFFAYWQLRQSGCRIDYLPASDDLRLFTVMLRGGQDGQTC